MSTATPAMLVAYMDKSGRYNEIPHVIDSNDGKTRFIKLVRWAAHNGVELRIRPIVPQVIPVEAIAHHAV